MDSPRAIEEEVTELLALDTGRIDDPRPIPEDHYGWHQTRNPDRSAIGAPTYDPESWRFFELVKVAVTPAVALVLFRWNENGAPDRTYVLTLALDADQRFSVAYVLRTSLRNMLESGWWDAFDLLEIADKVVVIGKRKQKRKLGPSGE